MKLEIHLVSSIYKYKYKVIFLLFNVLLFDRIRGETRSQYNASTTVATSHLDTIIDATNQPIAYFG